MEIQFLAPFGGAVAFLGVVPLLASVAVVLRASRVRSRLGLRAPTRRSRLPVLAALVLVSVLVGLAAAEPVIARGHVRHVRVGAEALFVVDTSRSMLARPAVGAPTRLARAKESALALRSSLDDVRVGLASLTGPNIPHLLSSADPDVFASVLARSIGIEAPGPSGLYTSRATDLGALAVIPTHGYFPASARRRLVVVFTDGESRPFDPVRLRSVFGTPPAIQTIVIRFSGAIEERVYTRGLPDVAYRPDSGSAKAVAAFAAATLARSTMSAISTRRPSGRVKSSGGACDRDRSRSDPNAARAVSHRLDSRPALAPARSSQPLATPGREGERGRQTPSRPHTTRAGSRSRRVQRGRRSRVRLERHRHRTRACLLHLRPHAASGTASRPRRRRIARLAVPRCGRCGVNELPGDPGEVQGVPDSQAVPSFCGTSCRPLRGISTFSLTFRGCAIYLQPLLKVCLTSPAS